MTRLAILFAATAATFSQAAFAADMPRKGPVVAPAPVAPSWTGFYVGLNLGYGWSKDQSAVISPNDPGGSGVFFTASPGINPSGLKSNGVLGGLQLGYNWQFAPSWVLGFETDFQASDLSDTSTTAFLTAGFPFSSVIEQQINWFGTVRGRLGFLITPNWLVPMVGSNNRTHT